jgi:hypothetical protein
MVPPTPSLQWQAPTVQGFYGPKTVFRKATPFAVYRVIHLLYENVFYSVQVDQMVNNPLYGCMGITVKREGLHIILTVGKHRRIPWVVK